LKKTDLKRSYEQMRRELPATSRCEACKVTYATNHMHRHHVNGRYGERLLEYIMLCPPCHQWVHENPAAAKERGLYHTKV